MKINWDNFEKENSEDKFNIDEIEVSFKRRILEKRNNHFVPIIFFIMRSITKDNKRVHLTTVKEVIDVSPFAYSKHFNYLEKSGLIIKDKGGWVIITEKFTRLLYKYRYVIKSIYHKELDFTQIGNLIKKGIGEEEKINEISNSENYTEEMKKQDEEFCNKVLGEKKNE